MITKFHNISKVIAIFGFFAFAMSSCQDSKSDFNLHGHRGCRGLLPENSIPAFIKAVELGCQTLELDVAVSAEDEIIVSHEPYFNPDICYDSLGNEFSEHRARELKIMQMTYDEIAQFDCGSKFNPRFPNQENFSVAKPRLVDLIDTVEAHCKAHDLPLPDWNIEIKSRPEWDGHFTPPPAKFAKLVHELVNEKNIADRSIVQSFDVRTLQAYKKLDPDFNCALLVDNNLSPDENIERLGFEPPIYSPHYILVTADMVKWCHENDMKIYPWTVNEIPAMKKMMAYGVDGLITDFPNRYFEITSEN